VERRNSAWRRHLWPGGREFRHRRDLRARPEFDRLCPWWIGSRIGVDQSPTAWARRPTSLTGVSLRTRWEGPRRTVACFCWSPRRSAIQFPQAGQYRGWRVAGVGTQVYSCTATVGTEPASRTTSSFVTARL